MAQLHQLTVMDLVDKLNTGACTSVEIICDVLDAIDARDATIGAYLTVDREGALEQARAADAARATGCNAPLLGIPVAVQDLFNVKGQPCTCSSKMLEGYVAPYDATAIVKLRAAGAVLLGRVNMDEFAMGSSSENAALGRTVNPWNITRVPGGASGGCAASIAADEAIIALGSDSGGSIRQPASFCGCVGVKPTYGRVSRYGVTAFASSLDQAGTLSKTVADSALLLEIICGHDPFDSTSMQRAVPAFSTQLGEGSLVGMKLGVPKEYFVDGMDPEVEQAVRASIEQCRSLGAEIVDIRLPHAKYAVAAYRVIATAEASVNFGRFDGIRYGRRVEGKDPNELYSKTRAAGFGPEVKRNIILGTHMLSSGCYDAYYLRAQKVRTLIQNDFTEAFRHCDALLVPVTPTPAYKWGEKIDDPLKMALDEILTASVNLAGNCALSLPCGFSSDGLPIGLQIIGNHFDEATILKVGHAYEQTTEWHKRKPEIA